MDIPKRLKIPNHLAIPGERQELEGIIVDREAGEIVDEIVKAYGDIIAANRSIIESDFMAIKIRKLVAEVVVKMAKESEEGWVFMLIEAVKKRLSGVIGAQKIETRAKDVLIDMYS